MDGWDNSSRRWIIVDKYGNGVCMMGVRPINNDVGVPWLLGTDSLNDIKIFFMKISKIVISEMKKQFKLLVNFVDSRYDKSVKWLKWCDFKFDNDTVLFGTMKVPFYRFEMRTI
jgi:hypothetical protein